MTHAVVEIIGLDKHFGDLHAVQEVSFSVCKGRVTAFLGPNGAGKSTTLRMLLGLVRPDSGRAMINGRNYRDIPSPARSVGAVLDIASAHPGMTARAHLRTYCVLGGFPRARIDAVLTDTGVEGFADRRIGTFSTGMRQRLMLATALLGEPEILILDEPSNGLDPAGVVWLRGFLRNFAGAGGTVLLSSHVLSEVQNTVDDVVLIDSGRIVWTGALEQLIESSPSLEDAFLAVTAQGARP